MKYLLLGIWLAIAAAFLRGLYVFDLGGSAQAHAPIASAVCFVGALIGAILMFRTYVGR